MTRNQEITIVASQELDELRLADLVGRKGILVEEDLLPRHLGWWVELKGEAYLGEREWFIPLKSIEV